MEPNEFNKDECVKALNKIAGDIERVILFFKGDKFMEDDSEKRVQGLVENLMDHLQKEYKRCSEKKEDMSEIESKIYFPFLKDIFSRILIDPKSTPSRNWVIYLDDAQNNIKYYLNKLDEME